MTFIFTYSGENGSTQQVQAFTSQGIARTTYRVDKSGPLEIKVVSDPANTSDVLRFTIPAVIQPTGHAGDAHRHPDGDRLADHHRDRYPNRHPHAGAAEGASTRM